MRALCLLLLLAAPAAAQPDAGYGSGSEAYEELLDYAVPFAKKMLVEIGTFGPFGLALADDLLMPVQVWQDTYGPEEAMITAQVLRQFAEEGVVIEGQPTRELRAAAVAFDILTTVPGRDGRTDAISVLLEGDGQDPVAYVLPYVRDEDGALRYLAPLWRPQPALIFVGE